MPITAKELFDHQFFGRDCYPKVRSAFEGTYATRYFRVDTHEPSLVMTAMNLPATFEPLAFDASSVVFGLDAEKLGGEVYLVTVTYEPVQAGIRDPDVTAEDGLAFTLVEEQVDQAVIRVDAVDGITPIPETTIQANKIELVVTSYKSSVLGVMQAWNAIRNRINSNTVQFPNFRFSSEHETAPPRTLLASHIAIDPVKALPTLMKLTMRFAYTEPDGHDLVWFTENEEGVPQTGHLNKRYPQVSYNVGGLW